MTPADREKLVADFEHAIMALGTGETLHDLSPKIVTLKLARAALLAAMEPVGEVVRYDGNAEREEITVRFKPPALGVRFGFEHPIVRVVKVTPANGEGG